MVRNDPTDATNPRRSYWASGNSAYAITGMGKKYDDYPTVSDPMGVKGNCVKLTTCRTGSFGDLVKMPIAAGNLFIGTFRHENCHEPTAQGHGLRSATCRR